jgi:NADH-quinone oxidoreductase subunit H
MSDQFQLLYYIFGFVVFPGFLFTAIMGMLSSWIDRKVTARVQWRVGPPLLQPLYDFVKLLGKETVIPKGCSKTTFLIAPVFGLAAVTLVSTLLWTAMIFPQLSFGGDLLVVLYFLMVPAIAVIVGGFASKNPIASLGASREMKLMLAYELPFLLAVLVPIIASKGQISLAGIIDHQGSDAHGWIFGTLPGVLAMLVAVIVQQAKLTLVPFDIPEAETEIMSGPFVEYSGPPLAILKLTRMMMLFTMPVFLIVVFLGGFRFDGIHILWSVLKYVVLLVLITLIRNTNPRIRIDQAVRFFWGPVFIIAVIAVVLPLIWPSLLGL